MFILPMLLNYLTHLQSCLPYGGGGLFLLWLCGSICRIYSSSFSIRLCVKETTYMRISPKSGVRDSCLRHKNTQTRHSSGQGRYIFHQCSIHFLYEWKRLFPTKTEHKMVYLVLFLLGISPIINKYIKMFSNLSRFENMCFIENLRGRPMA